MSDAAVTIEMLENDAEWVRALARRLVADEAAADDLVQETWLAALRTPPEPTSVRAWLATVMRNALRQRRRSERRRAYHETAAPERRDADPAAEVVGRADAHLHLVRVVMALAEPYRATVLMRFFDGLSASEIAARTDLPVNTVRTRLKRAVATLRTDLDARSGGDGRAWRAALGPLLLGGRPAVRTGSGAAALTGAGVLSMGIATKLAVGAVAALVAVGVWWAAADGPAPKPVAAPADIAGVPADESAAAPERSPRAPKPTHAAPADGGQAPPSSPIRRVRVTDASGAALDDVLVVAFSGDEVVARSRTAGDVGAELGLEGSARLVVAARGRPVVVTDLAVEGATSVALPDGLSVAGLVRVDGDRPSEPLSLSLKPGLPSGRHGDIPAAVRKALRELDVDPAALVATTNAAGEFRFEGLPRPSDGSLWLPQGFEIDGGPATRVSVPSRDVVLELTAFPLVRGTVVDESGARIARATVGVKYSAPNGLTTEVVRHADTEGRFEIAIPVRFANGIALRLTRPDGLGERRVDLGAVEPGPRELGELVLAEARKVEVFVRDEAETDLIGAVAVSPYSVKLLAGPTGGDGVLELPLRESGAKFVVGALGYFPVERELPPDAEGPIRIELRPAPLLKVSVQSSSGSFPAGLVLEVRAADGRSPLGLDRRHASALVAAGATGEWDGVDAELIDRTAFAIAEDGRALIAALAPDREFTLRLVDQLGIEHATGRTRLTADRRTEVSMRVERRVATVRGRVTDPAGAPVPSAGVRLTSADHEGAPLVATSGADGRFEIPGVAAEHARVLVFAERHAMRSIERVAIGADHLALELQLASSVRIRVLDSAGEVVAKALVSMRLPAEGSTGRQLSRLGRRVEDGVYELRDVPHRRVEIRVRVAGVSHAFEVDGREGETTLTLPD